ncbi:hypothetical protein H1Q63_07360 [Desmonostoc muscorum CCALA 125]|nr:hypothetical protein [Desmonostoc muscorum CCALA 125]
MNHQDTKDAERVEGDIAGKKHCICTSVYSCRSGSRLSEVQQLHPLSTSEEQTTMYL